MSLLNEYIRTLLEQESEDYLYHITTLGRITSIAESGLGGGSAQFSNYSDYSRKRNFLTEHDGIRDWWSKVGNHSEHNLEGEELLFGTPVVLRIDAAQLIEDHFEDDVAGNRDVRTASNYIYSQQISPEYIEVYDGTGYWLIESYEGMDTSELLEEFKHLYVVTYDDGEMDEYTGEPLMLVNFVLPPGY